MQRSDKAYMLTQAEYERLQLELTQAIGLAETVQSLLRGESCICDDDDDKQDECPLHVAANIEINLNALCEDFGIEKLY